MSQFDWAERERLVIDKYKRGVPPKEIAHELKMSLRDVYKIINKTFKNKEKELTPEHQAILLFMKGKRPIDVAIKLKITLDEACRHFTRYKDSFYLGKFGQDYKFIRGYMPQLAEICEVMRDAGFNVNDLVTEYNLARDLGEMEERHLYLFRSIQDAEKRKEMLQTSVQFLESKLKQLDADIEASEHRLDLTNQFLTYQTPNSGYSYNQNTYPGQQYYNNYFRY